MKGKCLLGLVDIGEACAHALDIAKPATHPDGQVIAKAKAHDQAESPVHLLSPPPTRYEHRVSVRYEGVLDPSTVNRRPTLKLIGR